MLFLSDGYHCLNTKGFRHKYTRCSDIKSIKVLLRYGAKVMRQKVIAEAGAKATLTFVRVPLDTL
jgi:hypothetical protein